MISNRDVLFFSGGAILGGIAGFFIAAKHYKELYLQYADELNQAYEQADPELKEMNEVNYLKDHYQINENEPPIAYHKMYNKKNKETDQNQEEIKMSEENEDNKEELFDFSFDFIEENICTPEEVFDICQENPNTIQVTLSAVYDDDGEIIIGLENDFGRSYDLVFQSLNGKDDMRDVFFNALESQTLYYDLKLKDGRRIIYDIS